MTLSGVHAFKAGIYGSKEFFSTIVRNFLIKSSSTMCGVACENFKRNYYFNHKFNEFS